MSKSLPANLDIGKDGLRRQPLGIKLIFSEYVAIYFYHCVTLDLSIMAVHVFFCESSMGYLNIESSMDPICTSHCPVKIKRCAEKLFMSRMHQLSAMKIFLGSAACPTPCGACHSLR